MFSIGAFASNIFPVENSAILNLVENVKETPKVLPSCTIEVTTIITIDHGPTQKPTIIVIVTIEPCPISNE